VLLLLLLLLGEAVEPAAVWLPFRLFKRHNACLTQQLHKTGQQLLQLGRQVIPTATTTALTSGCSKRRSSSGSSTGTCKHGPSKQLLLLQGAVPGSWSNCSLVQAGIAAAVAAAGCKA
jgi:hypothetical protein